MQRAHSKFDGKSGLSLEETTVSGSLPPEYYAFNSNLNQTSFTSKMDSILIARKPNIMYQSYVILGHGKLNPRLYLRRLILTPTQLTVMNEDMSKETKVWPVSNILDVHWFREKRFSIVLRSMKNENKAKRLRKRSQGVRVNSPDVCSKTVIIETGHPAITARWVNFIKKACGVGYDAKLLGETTSKPKDAEASKAKAKSKSTDNASGVTKERKEKKLTRSGEAVSLTRSAPTKEGSKRKGSKKSSKPKRVDDSHETERDREEREAAMKVSGRRRGSQSMIIHRRPAVESGYDDETDKAPAKPRTPRGTEYSEQPKSKTSKNRPELRRTISTEFDPFAVGSPSSARRREYFLAQQQHGQQQQQMQQSGMYGGAMSPPATYHGGLSQSAPQQLPSQHSYPVSPQQQQQQQPMPQIMFDPFSTNMRMTQSMPAIPLTYNNNNAQLLQQQQLQQLQMQQQAAQQAQLMMNPFLLPSSMLPIGMQLPPLQLPQQQQQQQQQQMPTMYTTTTTNAAAMSPKQQIDAQLPQQQQQPAFANPC